MKSGYSLRSRRTGPDARFANNYHSHFHNGRRDSTPGARTWSQAARPAGHGQRTRQQGARCADQGARYTANGPGQQLQQRGQLQAINAIKPSRPRPGAGSRGILRQLSEIDQAPGAQLQPTNWPLIADHGPGASRTGSGINTPGQQVRRHGRRTWRLV